MKKLQKTLLALGTVAAVAAPMAAVVSCGSDDGVKSNVLTIVAEKTWTGTTQSVIDKFVETHADLMKTNGIDKIEIKESSAFDMADRLANKGSTNSGVSDIVLLPGDRITSLEEQGYIKAFSEKTLEEFATKEIGAGETFLDGAKAAAAPGLIDNNVYAIPENVEAMVSIDKGDAVADGPIFTTLSDLWKSNGYFNTTDHNLKDIVKSVNGATVFQDKIGDQDTKAFLTEGFTKALSATGALRYTSDGLDADAGKATPEIQKEWGKADGARIIAGPWELDALKEVNAKATPSKVSAENYNQWAGGWNFTLNSRIGDGKQAVAEALIGEFLKSGNAQAIYDGMDKISPTTAGKAVIDVAANATEPIGAIYEAVKGLVARPTAAEFGIVWGAYSSAINAEESRISAAGMVPATEAAKLAEVFITNIKAAIAQA